MEVRFDVCQYINVSVTVNRFLKELFNREVKSPPQYLRQKIIYVERPLYVTPTMALNWKHKTLLLILSMC